MLEVSICSNMFSIWLILARLMCVLWFRGNLLKSNMPLNQISKCLCILWEMHRDGPASVRKCMSVPLHVTIHSSAVISSVWRLSSKQRPRRTSIHIHRHALLLSWIRIHFYTCVKPIKERPGKSVRYRVEWKNTLAICIYSDASRAVFQTEMFPCNLSSSSSLFSSSHSLCLHTEHNIRQTCHFEIFQHLAGLVLYREEETDPDKQIKRKELYCIQLLYNGQVRAYVTLTLCMGTFRFAERESPPAFRFGFPQHGSNARWHMPALNITVQWVSDAGPVKWDSTNYV